MCSAIFALLLYALALALIYLSHGAGMVVVVCAAYVSGIMLGVSLEECRE